MRLVALKLPCCIARAEIQACERYPCNTRGAGRVTCQDVAGGADGPAGRICNCSLGTVYNDASGCAEFDACSVYPCRESGNYTVTCTDIVGGATNSGLGRRCTCQEGSVYSNIFGCIGEGITSPQECGCMQRPSHVL